MDQGFEVVSAGEPYAHEYLPNLARFFLDSDQLITNRVSTALFYAASLRVPITLLDDNATIKGEGFSEPAELEDLRKRIRHDKPDIDTIFDLAQKELGHDHLRSKEELASILGLTGPRKMEYPVRLLGSHTMRVVRKIQRVS